MGLIAWIKDRRAQRAAERYERLAEECEDARAESDDREWAVAVARGIYRDAAGYYAFSAPYLTDLAKRCGFVSQRQVEALLRIATQDGLTADGVAELVVPLREKDVVERPLLLIDSAPTRAA